MKYLLFTFSILLFASCQENELVFEETSEELTAIPLQSKESTAKYTSGDYTVTSKSELLTALNNASSGEIVYVDGDAEINIEEEFEIPEGVILASNRNENGSLGAKIYRNDRGRRLWIKVMGNNVEISGLRIQGPYALIDSTSQVQGITNEGYMNLNVNNSELSAFSSRAIYILDGTGTITNNFIHHNRMEGLGYGVALGGDSYALIEHNIFDFNRHDIAGSGHCQQSYEASYNLVLPNGTSHSFDMHSEDEDNNDNGPNCAGNNIYIHHNTFMINTHEAIRIRDIPQDEAKIEKNVFYHTDIREAVTQKVAGQEITPQQPYNNISFSGNSFFGNINTGSNNEDVILLESNNDLKKYPFDNGLFFNQDLSRIGHGFTYEDYFVGNWFSTSTSGLIVRTSSGQLQRYQYNGSFYGQGNGTEVGNGFNFDNYFIGDWTADSKTDLIGRNSNGQLFLYKLNTSYFSGLGQVGSGFNFEDYFIGDWYGNSKDELIGRHATGNMFLYRMGSSNFLYVDQVASGFNYEKYFPGKWIANARTSFITLDSSGNLELHKFNESTNSFDNLGVVGNGFAFEDYCVGDFTGDGIDDLVAIDSENSIFLYPFKNNTFLGNGGPIKIGHNQNFQEFLVGQWGN